MKLLIATMTLASMIAGPAIAQTNYEPPLRPAPRLAQPGMGPGDAYGRAMVPYAYGYGRMRSPNPGYDVYVDGRYVGSDPDPRIRTMMQNDDAMLGND